MLEERQLKILLVLYSVLFHHFNKIQWGGEVKEKYNYGYRMCISLLAQDSWGIANL